MVYFGAFFEVLALAYFLKGVFSMDIKFFSNTSSTCAVTDTAVIQGKLILANDPINPNDATTKSYVDNLVNTSQTVINNHINNQELHLTSAQSQLLSNLTVTSTQINYLSGVTSPIQAQLDSKVKLSGDTLTGNLTLVGDPTSALHAATKQYADSRITTISQIPTGFILLMESNPNGYSGFLQCNGANLSKTTYNNLYNIIGETYTWRNTQPLIGNAPIGNGTPWFNQYGINTTDTGLTGGFTQVGTIPVTSQTNITIVTNNYCYLFIIEPTTLEYRIYRAVINSDGTLGNFINNGKLNFTGFYSGYFITNNYCYIMGGLGYNDIIRAPVNSDGTLGGFTKIGTLPTFLGNFSTFVSNNFVYTIGGRTLTSGSNTIYRSPINSDGTLGSFTQVGTFPITIYEYNSVTTNNYYYILGGVTNNGSPINTIYRSPINSDGTLGSFTQAGTIPNNSSLSTSVITNNYCYIFGGWSSTVAHNTIYRAPVNSDGTLGSFTQVGTLPQTLDRHSTIVTSNYCYLIGGSVGEYTSPSNVIYAAPFTGGLNDYRLYELKPTTTDLNQFTLPNLTNTGPYPTESYYIKT